MPIEHKYDSYNGVVIRDPRTWSGEACADEFAKDLREGLKQWGADGRRGVWLAVYSKAAHLVPIAISQGFTFHHARGTSYSSTYKPGEHGPVGDSDYVMLSHWLADGESRLPPAASHHIGVAGFVYDPSTDSVLAIQEKTGPTAGRYSYIAARVLNFCF